MTMMIVDDDYGGGDLHLTVCLVECLKSICEMC